MLPALQAVTYYTAQLPYLSVNPAISYTFNWNNVMPGCAYLLAQASGFNRSSIYNTQVCLRLLQENARATWVQAFLLMTHAQDMVARVALLTVDKFGAWLLAACFCVLACKLITPLLSRNERIQPLTPHTHHQAEAWISARRVAHATLLLVGAFLVSKQH